MPPPPPVVINRDPFFLSPSSPMIKITTHHVANFLTHEAEVKEYISLISICRLAICSFVNLSKKIGYQFVKKDRLSICQKLVRSGQFVGYQFVVVGHLIFYYSRCDTKA